MNLEDLINAEIARRQKDEKEAEQRLENMKLEIKNQILSRFPSVASLLKHTEGLTCYITDTFYFQLHYKDEVFTAGILKRLKNSAFTVALDNQEPFYTLATVSMNNEYKEEELIKDIIKHFSDKLIQDENKETTSN